MYVAAFHHLTTPPPTHQHTRPHPPSFVFYVFRFVDSSSRSQPGYMHTLASELANETSPVFVRNAAGLALKNALTARVGRAFLSPIPLLHPHLRSLPPLSAHIPTGFHRKARARQSTRVAGSPSMSRSAARSRSLSCAGFTLSRSRPAQSLHRASRPSQP